MMNQTEEKEAFRRMAAYCSRAEHCTREILDKLNKWELDEDAKRRIVELLREEKYIDDNRYAQSFVHDKYKFAKWGKVKIRMALLQKQIDAAVIYQCLEGINQQEYLSILTGLLKAKKKTIKGDNDYERSAKLIRFAAGRGFELTDIRQCMDIPDDLDI